MSSHGARTEWKHVSQASMCARQLPFPGPVIGDMGMVRPEIMKKLSTIPVYTVTNDEQELVIISGEVCGVSRLVALLLHGMQDRKASSIALQKDKDGSQSKMVHFYFSRKDAEELVERVCRCHQNNQDAWATILAAYELT